MFIVQTWGYQSAHLTLLFCSVLLALGTAVSVSSLVGPPLWSPSIWWIVTTFCSDNHVSLRMNFNNFGDPLTFHLVPSSGHNLSHTWVYVMLCYVTVCCVCHSAGSVILESPALPVMEGHNVTLRCTNKKPSFKLTADFYKDGVLIMSSFTGNMTIHSVSKSDEGLYKCSISGAGGSPVSWLNVRGER